MGMKVVYYDILPIMPLGTASQLATLDVSFPSIFSIPLILPLFPLFFYLFIYPFPNLHKQTGFAHGSRLRLSSRSRNKVGFISTSIPAVYVESISLGQPLFSFLVTPRT